LRLRDAPLRVVPGLLSQELVLFHLLLKNRNLRFRRFLVSLGGGKGGPRLVLAIVKLRVTQNSDYVACLDLVAFAHAHFEKASCDLWRDGRIVTLDPAAQ
jgi:hypothetical protein